MPWKVDRDLCTGCGLCTEHEGYIELDSESISVMIKPQAPKDDKECMEAAATIGQQAKGCQPVLA